MRRRVPGRGFRSTSRAFPQEPLALLSRLRPGRSLPALREMTRSTCSSESCSRKETVGPRSVRRSSGGARLEGVELVGAWQTLSGVEESPCRGCGLSPNAARLWLGGPSYWPSSRMTSDPMVRPRGATIMVRVPSRDGCRCFAQQEALARIGQHGISRSEDSSLVGSPKAAFDRAPTSPGSCHEPHLVQLGRTRTREPASEIRRGRHSPQATGRRVQSTALLKTNVSEGGRMRTSASRMSFLAGLLEHRCDQARERGLASASNIPPRSDSRIPGSGTSVGFAGLDVLEDLRFACLAAAAGAIDAFVGNAL